MNKNVISHDHLIKFNSISSVSEANSSKSYFSQSVDEFLNGLSKADHFLKAELVINNEIISTQNLYFTQIKKQHRGVTHMFDQPPNDHMV